MIRKLADDLWQIRGALVSAYLLVEEKTATLIDTGFVGHVKRIEAGLRQAGKSWSSVGAILLTHGHLDHAFNAAEIAALSGAPIFAHPEDRQHLEGRFPYRGIARGCGLLEAAGRMIWRYRTPVADCSLADGDYLPFWGGLRVVHLPGHTRGHCGFYSPQRDLLFAGDLFATRRLRTFLPYSVLNSCPALLPASLSRTLQLNPRGILCNHCDRSSDAATQAARFRATFGKSSGVGGSSAFSK